MKERKTGSKVVCPLLCCRHNFSERKVEIKACAMKGKRKKKKKRESWECPPQRCRHKLAESLTPDHKWHIHAELENLKPLFEIIPLWRCYCSHSLEWSFGTLDAYKLPKSCSITRTLAEHTFTFYAKISHLLEWSFWNINGYKLPQLVLLCTLCHNTSLL